MTPTEKFELAMRCNFYIFLAQLAIGCIPLMLMALMPLMWRKRS